MCFSAFHYYTALFIACSPAKYILDISVIARIFDAWILMRYLPKGTILYHLWNETPCTSFPSDCRSLDPAYCRGVSVIYESLITPIKLEGGLTRMFYSNHGGTRKRKQSGEVFRRDVSPMISKSYVGLPDKNVRTLRRSLLWSLHGPES